MEAAWKIVEIVFGVLCVMGASLLLNQSHIMLISCNSTAVRRFYIGYRPSGRHPVLCMTRIDPFV